MEVSTFECSTDQFVICLVLPESLSARIFFISDSKELLVCSHFSFSLGFFGRLKLQSQRKVHQIFFISRFSNRYVSFNFLLKFSHVFTCKMPKNSHSRRKLFLKTFVCWRHQRAQWEYWIWLHELTSYVINDIVKWGSIQVFPTKASLNSSVYLICSSISDCPDLNKILEHGQISGNGSTIGSTYSFHCDEGFAIEGPSMLSCDERGQWNASVPVCSRGKLNNLALHIGFNSFFHL